MTVTIIDKWSYYNVIVAPLKIKTSLGVIHTPLFLEYMSIYIYMFYGFLISSLLILISYVSYNKKKNFNKQSPYECGFESFNNSRSALSINFFSLALLFLMFDLELALIFPWICGFSKHTDLSFFSMFFFSVC